MSTTNAMIVDWAREKGILDKATPLDQILKTIEEIGELAGAVSKGLVDEQIDGIGDVYVTLVIVDFMLGNTTPGMVVAPVDEMTKQLTPKGWVALTNSVIGQISFWISIDMVKQLNEDNLIVEALGCLRGLAESLGHSLPACVDHAYGVISKRSGTMKDGVFVKTDETPLAAVAWQAYQVISALTAELAEDPEHIRALEYFSDVANGDRSVDGGFLPFVPLAPALEVSSGAV